MKALLSFLRRLRAVHLMAKYRAALDAMDWQYLTRTGADYARGLQACERALVLQMKVDPDGEIWNSHPAAKLGQSPRPILRGEAQ